MLSSARVVPCPWTSHSLGVLRQLLKAVEDILRDQTALFDPSFDAGVGANADEAALAFENVNAIAVVNGADLVVHGGNTIAKTGLDGGDVHVLVLGNGGALAGGHRDQRQRCKDQKYAEQYEDATSSATPHFTITQLGTAPRRRMLVS